MSESPTPIRRLADKLAAAIAGWIPVSGEVVTLTITKGERDEFVRALSAVSETPAIPEGHVLVPIATLEKWGEAIEPYQFDGSYNNDGVINTMAEMATYVTKGHGHG